MSGLHLLGLDTTAAALVAVTVAVLLLTVQVAVARVPPLLAFVVAALAAALMLGMPPSEISGEVAKGIGDTLGSLVVVICLGAVFGKLIADSGAAQRIASTLLHGLKPSRMPLALALTGFIVGIPLYYNVGFVLLVPLVFSLVRQSGRPLVTLAVPLLCGLSVTHGFLPPHPSPLALIDQFHADLGRTLIYGLIVGLPTLLVAGPVFAATLGGIRTQEGSDPTFLAAARPTEELPGAALSFFIALLPVALLAAATALKGLLVADGIAGETITLLADPAAILLIAYAVALPTLGRVRGDGLPATMKGAEAALRDVAPILLIIAGAGAFKQVLVGTGVSTLVGNQLGQLPIPPLLLGWFVALVIRICLGSATVAGLTAATIVAPLVLRGGVDPNLMVLAIGAGSLMCSHVNDSGFWMFKEYFGLTLSDTLRSWSLMETLVGSMGIVLIMLLNTVVSS